MIKDVYKINKDGWAMKLMHFIWGYTYRDFPNMCPFFWLSLLNVMIVILIGIPYLLFKLTDFVLGKPCMLLIKGIGEYTKSSKEKVTKYCDDQKDNWTKNFLSRLESGDEKAFAAFSTSKKVRNKIEEYDYWLCDAIKHKEYAHNVRTSNITLAKKLNKLYEEWKVKEKAKQKLIHELTVKKWNIIHEKEIQAKARRQEIAKMTVKLQFVFKGLAYVFGTAGIILALYLLGSLAMLLTTLPWGPIMMWTFVGLIVAFCILSAYVIVYYFVKLVQYLICTWGPYCIPCEERRESIGNFFGAIVDGIVWLLKPLGRGLYWLGRGIKSLWELLMMIKANNCPAIDWKD